VICLDQLKCDKGLLVYDSPKSIKSSTRELFVSKLSSITELEQKGILPKTDYMPFEHQAYFEKGVSALTLSCSEPSTHNFQRFSLFDTDFSIDHITGNIAAIAEALAETLVINTPLQDV
jgi:hypothetical protein